MKKVAMILSVVLSVAMISTPANAEEIIEETFTEGSEALEPEVNADQLITDTMALLEGVEPELDLAEVDSVEALNADGGFRYYPQPEWYTNNGYDAITAYITNEKGEYVQRCFFVTDGSEWLMYDYHEYTAAEFFSKTEHKDEMYIPVQKAKSRKDNTKTTGIDESKVPTLTMAAWDAMVYDWRTLAQVPFTRDSAGRIIYAGEGGGSTGGTGEDEPTPTPAPEPSSELIKNTVTVNNNIYDVYYTKSVAYNGKKHVLSTAKATTKQSPDVAVAVYRNGEQLLPSSYTVKFVNNTNASGYGGAYPYFTVTLKNSKIKADSKLLASNRFYFEIVPMDIAKVGLTVKSIKYSNGTITLGNPVAKIDGTPVKMVARTAKNRKTGTYVAGYKDGQVVVYGVNNYAGQTTINLTSAKTISWSF